MFYLIVFLLTIPSPIFFILNAEALSVLVGLVGSRPWPLAVLAVTAGQCVLFSGLYLGGDKLTRRFEWLNRRVSEIAKDPERMDRYRGATEKFLILAGLFGLPPLVAMSALSPALGVRFRVFFAIAFSTRFLRFALLAGLPHAFADWFPLEAVPAWIRDLL